jgi:hypothetical protein
VKKVARLKWIEETFGKDFVLPYKVCRDHYEIFLAISGFEMAKRTWGMRTDFRDGATQGFNLPFVHHGTPEKAAEVWDKHKESLVYIVSENVLRRRYSAVAIKVDQEHVYFEYNAKEPEISQRDMYKRRENLSYLVLGPNNLIWPWPGADPIRSVRPEYARDLKFDEIYDIMIHSDVDEATFTLRSDGKLVVW